MSGFTQTHFGSRTMRFTGLALAVLSGSYALGLWLFHYSIPLYVLSAASWIASIPRKAFHSSRSTKILLAASSVGLLASGFLGFGLLR